MTKQSFHAADYGVLVAVLGLSSFIGVYFAWKDRRNTNNKEFLVGNRQLQLFPVTMSTMASFLSSVAILGIPSQNFIHGSQYMLSFVGLIIGVCLATNFYLPVFYEIDMISANQYLEKRFKSVALRKVVCAVTIIRTCFYMGVVLYGPSLALGSVTGLPVGLSILVNGAVCAFYTTIGGIKAVIWTDVVQMFLMLAGFLIVAVKGSIMAGGVGAVFATVDKQGLLEFFDVSINFQKTFTFWSVLIGCAVMWTNIFGSNQTMIQRFCALGSIRKARTSSYINMLGIGVTLTLAAYCGLTLFALYYQCDPVKASRIKKYDELMPYFVMDTLGHLPGLTGLFVTAVYSGSLSTMSSGYNAMAAITWEDFLKPRLNLSPVGVMWATKGLAAGYGVLTIVIAFLADSLPSILQACIVMSGSFSGATGAVFSLGVFFPWCGSRTALVSMCTGLGIAFWVAVGGIAYPGRPMDARTSLEMCTFNYTIKVPPPRTYYSGGIMELYHISYLWIPVISFFATFLLAIVITIFLGIKNADAVEPSLIAPVLRNFYEPASYNRKEEGCDKERTGVLMRPEKRQSAKEQENSQDILGYSNGHANYAMTNDQWYATMHTRYFHVADSAEL